MSNSVFSFDFALIFRVGQSLKTPGNPGNRPQGRLGPRPMTPRPPGPYSRPISGPTFTSRICPAPGPPIGPRPPMGRKIPYSAPLPALFRIIPETCPHHARIIPHFPHLGSPPYPYPYPYLGNAPLYPLFIYYYFFFYLKNTTDKEKVNNSGQSGQ